MGAKVDLDGASLHTARGLLVLDHLQVTDPRSPMTNLVEVGEIVARLNVRALLEKKAVIETLAVRGRGGLAQGRGTSAARLRTPRQARAVAASGDSVKGALEAQLRAADPEP